MLTLKESIDYFTNNNSYNDYIHSDLSKICSVLSKYKIIPKSTVNLLKNQMYKNFINKHDGISLLHNILVEVEDWVNINEAIKFANSKG